MSYSSAVVEPPSVEVGFAPPARQGRLSVAFRAILVIPQLFVLGVFGFVAEVTAFLGWFAALILGRLPAGFDRLIGSYIQYATRVYAYQYLLTGAYPPFDANAMGYPVGVWRAQQPLNRLAVLFRGILQIPAYVLLALASFGLGLASFFVWLIVLVAGRMPESLHLAVAAIVRYQTRVLAYVFLVTPTYPWGLFGDRAGSDPSATPGGFEASTWPAAPAPGPEGTVSPPAIPGPASDEPAPGSPGESSGLSPSIWASSDVLPGAVATAAPNTHLLLPSPAKRLVGLFLGLGIVAVVGYFVLIGVVIGSGVSGIEAQSHLTTDYQSLGSAVTAYQSRTAACERAGDLACADQSARILAAAFGRFGDQVGSITFPSAAQGDANLLQTASYSARSQLLFLAAASSGPDFVSRAQEFSSAGSNFDSAYQATQQALAAP